MKKYLAELLGTFLLTFVVILGVANRLPIITPLAAAVTVGMVVYFFGAISGANINPAATIGLWSDRKMSTQQAAGYIVMQFAGASIASILAQYLINFQSTLVAGNGPKTFLGEAIGTFILVFAITLIVHKHESATISGALIGSGLLIGAMIASSVSNGLLNPALAFGVQSFSFAYVVGPIIGSIAAVHAAKYFFRKT